MNDGGTLPAQCWVGPRGATRLREPLDSWVPVGATLATALGVLATVASGEFKMTWAYLLIDIPLVAVAAVIGFLVTRRLAATAR